jgi:iron-sulfur cluster repair protein YtfE (RIC family)
MEAMQDNAGMTPCGGPLPELEIPMINTMVTCLGSEHRKLDDHILQLALAATRLANDPGGLAANQRAGEVWDEIRRDLWSHLQIEDGLVFSWGGAHNAISAELFDTLKSEREQMRELLAALPALSSGADPKPQTASTFARTLLALAETLDSHIERYDSEVLPSILRALFHA